LARALQDYPGAVLMVSHDRHLLRTVIDEFYIVANGRAKPFDGDLDDYAKWAASNPRDAVEKAAELKAARKQADAAQRNRSSALKSELARLDRQLVKIQQQQQGIELQLSSADIYDAANKSRLRELLEQQVKLKHELDQAETDWLEVTELLQPKSGDALSQ
jgi:ATP-binding cassette subfamily F protein 3